MQTDLAKAVRTLVTEGAIRISRSEARWIEEEFKNYWFMVMKPLFWPRETDTPKLCTKHAHHLGSAI
jgi:hypothetical protein